MITIEKGNTQSALIVTITENLNLYSGTYSPHLYIVNDLTGLTYSIFTMSNQSPDIGRYDLFYLDETQFNFRTGLHTYQFFYDSGYDKELEVGRLFVTGTESIADVYK